MVCRWKQSTRTLCDYSNEDIAEAQWCNERRKKTDKINELTHKQKYHLKKKANDPEYLKKKVKEWLRYNIASSPENNNIDRNLTFEYIDDILYCNLHFNGYMTVFMSEIPDYVKINKITCKNIKFNSLYNLPKEIDGDMFIDGYNHTKLIGNFPEKIGCLKI